MARANSGMGEKGNARVGEAPVDTPDREDFPVEAGVRPGVALKHPNQRETMPGETVKTDSVMEGLERRDPPSSDDDGLEDRIRQKAYALWQEEGQPEGQAERHWDMARELVAQQENLSATLRPMDQAGDGAEPPQAFENQGEVPGLTDQGEGEPGPSRRALHETNET